MSGSEGKLYREESSPLSHYSRYKFTLAIAVKDLPGSRYIFHHAPAWRKTLELTGNCKL